LKECKEYIINDKHIFIDFSGSDFRETLAFVKSLPHAQFMFADKLWKVPFSPITLEKITNYGFVLKGSVAPVSKEVEKQVATLKDKLLPPTIRNFQIDAVKFIMETGDNCILALPAGSGKTMTAVVWAAHKQHNKPILIVCPAGLKVHWKRELKKWGRINAKIIYSYNPVEINIKNEAYIINYDILDKFASALKGKVSYIIADEYHMLANEEAQRTKAFMAIQQSALGRVLLSGTPSKGRIKELFNGLNMVAPVEFSSRKAFLMRYCPPSTGYMGRLVYDGAANLDELNERMKPYMFRRTKEQILPELPRKNKIVYELELDDEAFLRESQLIEEMIESGEHEEAEIKERLLNLSRSAYYLKHRIMWERIDSFLEETDEKIVLVAYHTDVVDDLVKKYNCKWIDGRINPDKRQAIIDKFHTDDDQRVVVLQLQAGGVGFSITCATTMAFLEMNYIPADLEQMEDRIHRLTSVGEQVNYWYFLAVDTVEEKMMDAIDRKSKIVATAIDGVTKSIMDGSQYMRIIE
jgi:SWI/SNF-related matrix-associated actin-dependent regulator of chromatin subfamily A-like protein 1